jgi:hypothetical protein
VATTLYLGRARCSNANGRLMKWEVAFLKMEAVHLRSFDIVEATTDLNKFGSAVAG